MVVAKYVGKGEFINGVAARDLTDEDWEVMGRQGRQQWVIDSPLYEMQIAVDFPRLPSLLTPMPSIDKTIDEALATAGFETISQVEAATDDQLLALSGVGKGGLKKIRTAVAQSYASQIERLDNDG